MSRFVFLLPAESGEKITLGINLKHKKRSKKNITNESDLTNHKNINADCSESQ